MEPTQIEYPWRATARTIFQGFVGLCALLPLVLLTDTPPVGAVAVALTVSGAVTRTMAITKGTVVEVRTATGEFVKMRALGSPTLGRDFIVVWVCSEENYSAEGDVPRALPWPAKAVMEVPEIDDQGKGPVSLHGLDPAQALKAILKVDPRAHEAGADGDSGG